MKRWALLTVVLYMLVLLALAWPLIIVAFLPQVPVDDVLKPFSSPQQSAPNDGFAALSIGVFVWAGVMGLAQAALLVVPVRIAGRRPVTRRWLVWPIIAAVLLLLLMVGAMYLAVGEFLANTEGVDESTTTIVFCVMGAFWLLWTFLFGFYCGNREPKTFMSRLVKSLLAGSILELLVAVPTHVIARVRDYCCAGFGTFWGLATGLSVMLFAFGPGVFMLFVRRWASVRTGRGAAGAEQPHQ